METTVIGDKERSGRKGMGGHSSNFFFFYNSDIMGYLFIL